MEHSGDERTLVMLPEVEARALLAERPLAFSVIRPPFPALGVGELRVLRVRERDGRTELAAGYDRYERLDG